MGEHLSDSSKDERKNKENASRQQINCTESFVTSSSREMITKIHEEWNLTSSRSDTMRESDEDSETETEEDKETVIQSNTERIESEDTRM